MIITRSVVRRFTDTKLNSRRINMKSITRSRCSVAMFLLVFQLSDALAHHSRAEFSPETLKLEGELVSVRWLTRIRFSL